MITEAGTDTIDPADLTAQRTITLRVLSLISCGSTSVTACLEQPRLARQAASVPA